jgi:hypothetical protein
MTTRMVVMSSVKDEDEEKSAQQLKHHGDERPLAQVADEVVHDDPEQDGPTDDEGQCDHGVDEELAVAKQRRDPRPIAALPVSASRPHGRDRLRTR